MLFMLMKLSLLVSNIVGGGGGPYSSDAISYCFQNSLSTHVRYLIQACQGLLLRIVALSVIPSCPYGLLFLISQFAAWTTLCGLTLRDNAELLYCNFLFKLTFIVPVSLGNLGNILTVLDTSAGTLTTFPCFLNGLPLGAKSVHSNSFRSKKSGFTGNCIPFTRATGGTLFFTK